MLNAGRDIKPKAAIEWVVPLGYLLRDTSPRIQVVPG